jgi:sec-independent protein translocase protein TatB
MFDFDAGKLIVIGVVALIAIPSKDLPRVLRTLGQVTGKMRRMAAEFQGQLSEALREAELADLKKEFDETNRKIMETTGAFDPMTQVRKQIARTVDGAPRKKTAAVDDAPRPEEPQSGAPKDPPDEKASS